MTFPVVGSNIPSSYQISNSLRFNDNDSAYLSRTPGSAGDRRTFTLSVWFKLTVFAGGDANYERQILSADDGTGGNNNFDYIAINNSGQIFIYGYEGAENQQLKSTQLLRDASAWYHLVVAFDTTQATASNRIKVYLNGNQVTAFATANYPSLNFQTRINNTNPHYIGKYPDSNTQYFDGYMAEYHLIDGQQLDASSFGEFDEDSGVWKPKQYAGTYGTNGFYLKFNNTGNMGEDSSGNDNTWTPTNLSGTTDVTTDTPTNNFATYNPNATYPSIVSGTLPSYTFSEGNTKVATTTPSGVAWTPYFGTTKLTSGKWYWEVKYVSGYSLLIGVINASKDDTTSSPKGYGVATVFRTNNGQKGIDGTFSSFASAISTNDIVGVALNLDDDEMSIYVNGSQVGGSVIALGSQTKDGGQYLPVLYIADTTGSETNFGNPPFSISSGNSDENGYGNFEYAPPSGYLALCTQNLATVLSPTIDDGSQYFDTLLYTGDGTTRDITGMNYKPDLLWVKRRSSTLHHRLWDTTRGAGYQLYSSLTNAEAYDITAMSAFLSDGFSIPSGSLNNTTSETYVAWHWKANAGSTSSNTDGSITSTVQANTTAGFSIVTYTGTQANATVGHGLGVAPKFIITKCRSASNGWPVYHYSLSATDFVRLNETAATATNSIVWNNTEPTSTVFTVGANDENNKSGANQLAYCFAEIEGYSKFGKYTGNGSSDGTFVYTGFRPAFVICKRTNGIGSWVVQDNKRPTYNQGGNYVYANASNTEATDLPIDILSNGFKQRQGAYSDNNGNGDTYIYMAFAENPFVTSGATPVTAR